jgi:hypothetical protein
LLRSLCIKGIGFSLDNLQSIDRAFTNAGSKTIAVIVCHELCLAIDKLYCTFCACVNALSATITFIFINLNDFSF